MAPDSEKTPESRGFGTGYAIVGAGFQFAFAIVLFLGGGHLVDRWLHTRPLFTLIGLLLGLGAGFYAFMRRVVAESAGGRARRGGDAR